jgi:hypothetical protein
MLDALFRRTLRGILIRTVTLELAQPWVPPSPIFPTTTRGQTARDSIGPWGFDVGQTALSGQRVTPQ